MKRPRRKAIPLAVRREVFARQLGRCTECNEHLDTGPMQFDHRPALWSRPYNSKDYVPGQLDPDYIEALHIKCHDKRSHGRGGEKRITTAGSDAGNRAKLRRLRGEVKGRKSRPIPSRPFSKQHRPMRGK